MWKTSRVRPLQQAPKRRHTIGVSLAPDVLSDRVLHRFVVRQDVVGQCVVGVNLGLGSVGMLHNKSGTTFRSWCWGQLLPAPDWRLGL